MAAFDASFGHIVVRVVFDGPAGSGKTENLKQLVQTFTAQRRGEMSSPRKHAETTSYFDWLYLNGGVVAGHGLRAQLVTVPGRSVLTRRRWQLVKTADVIVFVCESTPRGVKEAKRWLELLRAHLIASSARPPIIVQANKQDLPDAMPLDEIARALGLASDAEIVGAAAPRGTGVRETVVRAIRAAASIAERDVVARGVDGLPPAQDESHLLADLDGSAQLRAALDLREDDLPPFPDEEVASGSVWPGTTGRTLLRSVARALAESGVERVPSTDAIVVRAGRFRLGTSPSRRYRDPAEARAALLDEARGRVRIGALQAPEAALVLASGDDGATWLWSVSPWVSSLRSDIELADAKSDDAKSVAAARWHGRAAAEAIVVGLRERVGLPLDAEQFGVVADRVVYLGDRIGPADPADTIADRVRAAAAGYGARPPLARAFAEALGAALEKGPPSLDGVRASLASAVR